MDNDPESVRALLAGALNAKNANATELSRLMNRGQGYISDFLHRKKARLDAESATFLENALSLPAGALTVARSHIHALKATSTAAHRRRPYEPANDNEMAVYSATEGGLGEFVISNEPIEHVPRPWYLKNVREGYAVLVVGESMEPRYSPGEIVVVNPKAALVRGKDCIVTSERLGGDFRAMVKTYAGATDQLWRLRQFNPEKTFDVKKRDWPTALRVVGRYDGG